MSKVRKLVETRDPTKVNTHLKKVATALHSDGYGEEVNILDPRAEYKRFKAPQYDDKIHGMAPAALSILKPGERLKSVRNNVERFETERRRIDLATEEQEKKLYYLLRGTLSASSLGRVINHGSKRFELAEIRRDTAYLVATIIITHSSSITTGLSIIATQQLVMQRVSAYMSCVQGNSTLQQYLETMNDHIKAIASMDPNVDELGEGGYLGSKQDQVARFLLGTGATVIIHAHMNCTLAAHRVPTTLEDVCSLIANWGGPIRESGDGRPTTSIMAMEERDDDDEQMYSIAEKGKPAKRTARGAPPTTKAEWIVYRTAANKAAEARGVEVPDPATWKANASAPAVPLVRTQSSTNPADKVPCHNCYGFHPDPDRGDRTSWITCTQPWDARHYERHLNWLAQNARRKVKKAAPKDSTLGSTASE